MTEVTVRLTEDAPSRYRYRGQTYEPGDELEVPEERADRDYFERVDEESLEDLTKTELMERAREEDVEGRSSMDKDELIEALA